MIDKTIKNLKKILYKVLEGLLTAKISKKKILCKVLEGVFTAKIANNFFFFFCISYI